MVSSVRAVSRPPRMGQDMCRTKCRVYTRRQSMSRKPSRAYSQKCASLRMKCMVMWDARPGIPSRVSTRCTKRSTRPLAPSDTTPICMELEKMNAMQPMSASVKITRPAMSQGEVRGFCSDMLSPEP